MNKEKISAALNEKERILATINLQNLRGPNGLSAYEIYVANLSEGETPMTEKEWLDSINKANYYKQYENVHITSNDGEKIFNIGINEYNSTCLLDVYINGLRLDKTEYELDVKNKTITLNRELKKGQEVLFVVKKTTVATATDYDLLKGATFMPSVSDTGDISWTNNQGLDNPETKNIRGATYTPNLDDDGNLSWSNDKNLENPETKNIKGPKGEQGIRGSKWYSGDFSSISIDEANVGDMFLDTSDEHNGDVYIFTINGWDYSTNIRGKQGIQGVQGEKGNDGLGVPAGGTAGQVLVKNSDADNDTKWANSMDGEAENLSNNINQLKIALGLNVDTYNSSQTYQTGDMVIYNSTIYECKTDNTTGEWDSTKWDIVPIITN